MAVTKIQPTGVNSSASFTFANVTATGNVLTSNLSVSGNLALSGPDINLGSVSNVKITGGTNGYVLQTDGTGNLSWTAQSGGGGGGTPGGSNTQVQFNDSSSFGGSANFTFDKTTNVLTVAGNVIANNANLGNLVIANYFSGSGNLLSNIQGANVSGQVTYAATANAVAGANVSGEVSYAATANSVAGGNVVGQVTYAATANSVSGSNVSGEVSYAATANSVSGSNVVGAVTYATTANAVAGSNVSGEVSYAATANSVSGSNVVGQVTYAATANSVSGSNVSGEVSYAATANAVAGGNVSGQVANALVAGTVYTNAQPNITSVGTLSTLSVSGNAVITGNLVVDGTTTYVNTTNLLVQDPIIEQGGGANGAALSTDDGKDRGIVLHYYSGSTKDAFMGWDNSNAEFSFGSNVSMSGEVATFNTLGNIRSGNASLGNLVTASYFSGSGNLLSNVQGSNISGEVAYAATANSVAGGNVTGTVASATTAGTVTSASQPNVTALGTLTSLTVTSSITLSGAAGYVKANSLQGPDGSQTIYLNYGSVAGAAGVVSDFTVGSGSAGNLTVNGNFISNGSIVTSTTNQDLTIDPNGTGKLIVSSTTPAEFGNTISAAGNVTASYIIANGSALTSLTGANVTGTVANANYAAYAAASGLTGTTLSSTVVSSSLTSVGTLTSLTVTANTTSGNLLTGGVVSATGNVTGSYILGNGSQLTSVAATTAGTVTTAAQPNITSLGTLTSVSVSGNANVGNLNTAGVVSAVGNITGNYHIGNGSTLTHITAGNIDGQVANALVAGTVYTNAQPNITSVGTLTSLSVTGNVTSGNLKTDNLLYANGTAWSMGGGGTPGGSNTYIQFNDGGSFGGNTALTYDKTSNRLSVTNYSVVTNVIGNATGSKTINLSLGTYVTATSTGTTTWTFSNPATSGNASGFVLELTNGGAYTQIWPGAVKWPSGAAPTLTSSGVDVLVFLTDDGGTTWRGVASMVDSK